MSSERCLASSAAAVVVSSEAADLGAFVFFLPSPFFLVAAAPFFFVFGGMGSVPLPLRACLNTFLKSDGGKSEFSRRVRV